MKILAFDTSTTYCSIAYSHNGMIIAENMFTNKKTHSTKLLPSIRSILDNSQTSITDIDAIAIGIGPGSFTGIRIALSTAKGLCYGNKIPLIPVSTLCSLANNIACPEHQICSILNAGRDQLYTALFSPSLDEIRAPQIHDRNNLLDNLQKKTILVGPPVRDSMFNLKSSQKNNILFSPPHLNYPHASSIINHIIDKKIQAKYHHKRLADIQPLYIRKSAAEENFTQ